MDYHGSRGPGPCRTCGQNSPGRWPGDRCSACWRTALHERHLARQSRPTWMYRLYDAGGGLLYIGITQREPRERFKEHRKTMLWWPEVARRDVLLLDVTFHAAELLERAAIRDERPLYNHHGQPSDEPGKRRQRPDGYWTQPWRCDYPDPASWSRAWFEWRAVVRDERLTPAERAARNAAGAV